VVVAVATHRQAIARRGQHDGLARTYGTARRQSVGRLSTEGGDKDADGDRPHSVIHTTTTH
jgi:hypothetical protein